jgi:hypothetical protein
VIKIDYKSKTFSVQLHSFALCGRLLSLLFRSLLLLLHQETLRSQQQQAMAAAGKQMQIDIPMEEGDLLGAFLLFLYLFFL